MAGSFDLCRQDIFDEDHWVYFVGKYNLTPRELQVAKLVCRGFNNKGVASALDVKSSTAKTHLRSIYKKLQVANRVSVLLRLLNDVSPNLCELNPNITQTPLSDNDALPADFIELSENTG